MYDNIDKNIENEAWERMRSILDQEMPQEQKRGKRLILWLLLLLLPFILSGVLYFVHYSKSFSEKKDPVAHDMAVNEHFKQSEKVVDQKISSLAFCDTQNAKQPNLLPVEQDRIFTPIRRSASNELTSKGRVPFSQHEINTINPVTDVFAPGHESEVGSIPPLPLQLFSIMEPEGFINSSDFLASASAKKRERRRNGLGLSAGVGSQSFQGLNSWQVGLIYSFGIAKRWELLTGLQYERNSRFLWDVKKPENLFLSSSGSKLYNVDQFEVRQGGSILESKEILHSLGVPIYGRYYLMKRTSLDFGSQFSFLFVSEPLLMDFQEDTSTHTHGHMRESIDFKRFDVSLVGGINFHVSEKWVLGATHRQTLGNLSKTSGLTTQNNFSGLKLQFFFR